MSRGLSESQSKTAVAIREKMDEHRVSTPLALPRTELALAHRAGYENLAHADDKTVSAYVSHNLSSPVFMAALGFEPDRFARMCSPTTCRISLQSNPSAARNTGLERLWLT